MGNGEKWTESLAMTIDAIIGHCFACFSGIRKFTQILLTLLHVLMFTFRLRLLHRCRTQPVTHYCRFILFHRLILIWMCNQSMSLVDFVAVAVVVFVDRHRAPNNRTFFLSSSRCPFCATQFELNRIFGCAFRSHRTRMLLRSELRVWHFVLFSIVFFFARFFTLAWHWLAGRTKIKL